MYGKLKATRRFFTITLGLTLTLSLTGTGCSKVNSLGYDPVEMSPDQARQKTKEISSQIFDLISMRNGQTTPTGPGVSTCPEDPKSLFIVRHSWSVYGVSMEELSRGFENLKARLPKHGWKITEDGPDGSKARTPHILADLTQERFSANIKLIDSSKDRNTASGKGDSGIWVMLVSACFKAPPGVDLKREY
ncbi:hypothetical protein GCM10010218_22860 [Streptomyces mashuensis]|uniref:Lipoprotein n=1 Tax=Streptomyces mashuensis TaxID=33904 RepID=A0A919ECG6_9ACTN|nr:hypothetical protein [Streptomyces mashuensis]GHF40872.1 hypothetical protein GCM10010218_22860 [Streptomyces mashuensis]